MRSGRCCRAPGFTAMVIADARAGHRRHLTMFSLMRGVLWRPLPYPEPDRSSRSRWTRATVPAPARHGRGCSYPKELQPLVRAGCDHRFPDANLDTRARWSTFGGKLSDDFLPLLGVRPASGRLLDSRIDAGKQQALAILISDELWRRRFAADPGVIGTTVRINDLDMQIAGVLPPGFRLFLPPSVNNLEQIDVWLPDRIDQPSRTAASRSLRGSGRASLSIRRTPSSRCSQRNSSGSTRISIPAERMAGVAVRSRIRRQGPLHGPAAA